MLFWNLLEIWFKMKYKFDEITFYKCDEITFKKRCINIWNFFFLFMLLLANVLIKPKLVNFILIIEN